MGFKCGIVGLPNVGKSTLFNALTNSGIEAANYPFCTIEPNVGVVPVPDPRLNKLAEIVNPKQIIPTVMDFVDIAGLVAGASKGEGLGNKFLANIRETQAIAHVVRCFENENVTHVSGQVDPKKDIEIINTELVLADLETVDKALNKGIKYAKSGDKDAVIVRDFLQGLKEHLNEGRLAKTFKCDDNEDILFQLHLLTLKPVLYIANVDDIDIENRYLDQVRIIAEEDGSKVIPVCASMESEISELEECEKEEFLTELGLSEPGLDKIIRAGYDLLGLQTFFTAGPKEVRAWTFHRGDSALKAAGVIHTDFQRGFIRAETISYDDFILYKGEQLAKEAGKLRLEGKNYVVQDGDVMHFRFNI